MTLSQERQALLDQLSNNPAPINNDVPTPPVIMTAEEIQRQQNQQPAPVSTSTVQQSTVQQPAQQQPAQQPAQQQPTISDADIAAYLQQQFGLAVPPDQVRQEIQNYVQQQQQTAQPQNTDPAAQAISQLAAAWNVPSNEVTRRAQLLQEQYGDLVAANPQLGTIDGIKTLWTLYETQSVGLNKPSSGTPPTPTQPAYKFTMSQLQSMDEAEYARRSSEILQAFAQEQVNLNA